MASCASLHNQKPVHQAAREMFYYLCRFRRYPQYDKVEPEEPDRITDQDRRLANKLAARMGKRVWEPLIGQSISAIEANWNLLGMTDRQWLYCAQVTSEVLSPLFVGRVGVARLTKALHRKRPNFMPICDSVLVAALQVKSSDKATTVVQCMEGLRKVGQASSPVLTSLRNLSMDKGMEMTELRILELLYWVIFGPFGTPQQRDSFRSKCQALRASGECLADTQKSPCV
ncbi:MAG: DUF6308 family protein [Chloroflexi bacterium]|nr:DUF6308 family protein [Chloroflexota bacterium]